MIAMKYLVSATVTISLHTKVEADSPEEAQRIATLRDLCGISTADSYGESAEEVWHHSGELDGEPCDLRVEKDE